MQRLATLSAIVLLVTLSLIARPAVTRAADTPNVVVIFIDDMGYADVGPFAGKDGLPGYETPNIDRMATEGRVFTDFYVSQAVCSASRAGLMTGCYNIRVGIQGALGPNSRIGINADEMTIAEVCKQKGYATAIFGKWHLGDAEKFLPLQHGFDEYFGLPYSNDMWPYHPAVMHLPMEQRLKRWPNLPLIEGNKVINPALTHEDQEKLTTQYTEHAVSFIERNKDKPFFLYVPHSMVHVPLHVSDRFKGKSKRGLFGDVMMEVDWSVGQILDTLRKNNLEKNTLVIFTADNGPWLSYGDHAGSAGPLREGKGTEFDGGCRESCIMWMPGTVPAGTRTSELAMTIDILPTVAHLIGAKLPDHKIDGLNIWPLIKGEPDAKSPHEAMFMYWGTQLQAVRMGKWKLHFPHDYRTLDGKPGGTGGIPANYSKGHIELSLFDLENDIGETKDVKDDYPDVVKRIMKLADEMRKDLGDGKDPGTGRREPGKR
ncbi:MAG: sulfatase-like hydrolase/transferase [Phycisphaera sp.]|nr:sulfatase-like hydrolase/transferase [Phycisphaera sp.]